MKASALKEEILGYLCYLYGGEIIITPEKVKNCSDMEQLIIWRKNTSSDSEPRKLIEARMAEVFLEILPECSDMEQLIAWWKNTSSDSEPRKLIEARMAEVLPDCSDMEQLIAWWENTSSDSEPEKLIEARITALIKDFSADNIPQWVRDVLNKKYQLPEKFENDFKERLENILADIT